MGGWMDGWMGGWVGGWMDGHKSRFKDCLQQSKIIQFWGVESSTRISNVKNNKPLSIKKSPKNWQIFDKLGQKIVTKVFKKCQNGVKLPHLVTLATKLAFGDRVFVCVNAYPCICGLWWMWEIDRKRERERDGGKQKKTAALDSNPFKIQLWLITFVSA